MCERTNYQHVVPTKNPNTNLVDLESGFTHGLKCTHHAFALVEAEREPNQIFEVSSVAFVVVLHLFHRARPALQVRVKPLIQPISIKHHTDGESFIKCCVNAVTGPSIK